MAKNKFRLTYKTINEWICTVMEGYEITDKRPSGEGGYMYTVSSKDSPISMMGAYFMGNNGHITFFYQQNTGFGYESMPLTLEKNLKGDSLYVGGLSEDWNNKKECFKELDEKYADELIKFYNNRVDYYNDKVLKIAHKPHSRKYFQDIWN